MKISYKQKLFVSFVCIFALFTIGIAILEQSRERQQKTEEMEGKLDAYAGIVHAILTQHPEELTCLDSLQKLFPENIRLTIINRQGKVLYDNAVAEVSLLENHSERPEIVSAKEEGTGSNIRISSSNQQEYLYYARRFNNRFVRVALPYDVGTQNFLKPDNVFLYYILALFVIVLLLISYATDRFGKSIRQLKDFTTAAQADNISAYPVGFPNDELGEIGTKITESYRQLKESKKEIALEREKLLQHVHSSEEGLCFFTSARTVEFYNGLFIQYLNIIMDEANSEPASVLKDPAFEKAISFLSDKDRQESYFEMQISRQGQHFALRVNVFEDGGFEIIINDVTKQEKTRLLKQEITGNIAHELRTPVTSIRGYLETVLEQSLDADKQHHFLTKAYKQALTLSELIQDMSLITKIEESPQSFRLEDVNIGLLLENLHDDLEIPLQQKGIGMTWSFEKTILVHGNQNLLYSVFRNLTDNVIRHAGVNVSIEVSIYGEDKDFYYFSYADTGIGIAEHHLNRLFERFYRTEEGRTRDAGGSGLGLSIVKNAILFHRGSIVVKNRLGGGLEFLFKLPK
ncbi:MAG: two-component sensor histidine kinase [Bacteroidales bacterium]|jgi:signal transduction histidine kinase|nr:two-component sensor histidine kinase [Bacteroidales bacterium]